MNQPHSGESAATPSLAGHLAIMRVDHWFKNVFALPGVVVALTAPLETPLTGLAQRLLLGSLALCLLASSNYVLNELLDAGSDREHPTKAARPVPAGRVNVRLAWLQWLVLAALAIGLGALVSWALAQILIVLWVMGCAYNARPLRTKDVPYLDVLTESLNNPLRLLAGWYMVDPGVAAPGSLQVSYWMAGAYFMAIKRYAEFRFIGDAPRAASYRVSFAYYTEERLLTSVMFYAASAMLFFGIFIARYRLELIFSFPFVALVMAVYLRTGLKPNSAAQRPEQLYKEPLLVVAVVACALVMLACLVVDVPVLDRLLAVFPREGYRPL